MTEPSADVAVELVSLGVSRETLEVLIRLVALVCDANQRMNLISRKSESDIWRRHVLDSAQLLPLLGAKPGRVVDLGSGAGFPGLILAVLGVKRVELVESQGRKCAFLRAVAADLGLSVTVHNARVEDLPHVPARHVIARALAPLPRLLEIARPLLGSSTRVILLKGAHVESELTSAHKIWKMTVTRTPSRSDPSGVILTLEGLRHAPRTVRSGSRTQGSRHRQSEGRGGQDHDRHQPGDRHGRRRQVGPAHRPRPPG